MELRALFCFAIGLAILSGCSQTEQDKSPSESTEYTSQELPNGMAMWPQQNGPWKPKDAESFARNFLEIAGYPDAGSARVESSKSVALDGVDMIQKVVFAKKRTIWVDLWDGQVMSFLDARPQVKGEFFFKSETEARDRVNEIAKRLGYSQQHQRYFYYVPPGKNPVGYVGVAAEYAVMIGGLPVFGGVKVAINLDPATGRMKSYEAERNFTIEKSEQKISKEMARALALRETAKEFGGKAKISEEPELGYVVLSGQKWPPYRVRLAWEIGLRNTFPYSVTIDAESGEPIGWLDTATRAEPE